MMKDGNDVREEPYLEGYEPECHKGATREWLVPLPDDAPEAEKIRLALWCMNERRKRQVSQTAYYREKLEALEQFVSDAGGRARLEAAIRATQYKYFGDYEMSDDQRDAVETLVDFARVAIAPATPHPIAAHSVAGGEG